MPAEVIVTDSELPSNVIRAIQDGRKIEAIKMLREETGLGLANAKVLVDRAARVHGPKKADHPAVKSSSGAGRIVVSLAAVLVLAAVYMYYLQ